MITTPNEARSDINLSEMVDAFDGEQAAVIKSILEDNQRQREEIETLRAEKEELREELETAKEETDERIETLEQRTHINWDGSGGFFEEAFVVRPDDGVRFPIGRALENRPRHCEVEDRVEEAQSEETTIEVDDANTPDIPDVETPLGQVINYPEHAVQENLTPNERRARSVAKDICQYGRSVDAGYALKASELRQVLSAQEDGKRIHGETLRRVRGFLEQFGKDCVEVVETMGGTTTVMFDDSFVKRTVAWRQADHGVVTPQGREGGQEA